jgi:simple sugar transport system substrate-binding protein
MTLLTKVSTLLVLALLLLGPATIGSSPPAAAQDDEPLRFVFVTHDLGAGIFAPVRTGMEDACELIGATCEFLGPQTYDPAQQVAILEAAIATEPDGIATTRPEPGVYDDVIQRAQEAGISVVTFNTNDPTADEVAPAPFVGQDFTNYGRVWAEEVVRVMPDGGQIAITNCCPGHFALEERIRSFTETLEAEGEGKYEILETIITGADEGEIFAAIEAFHAANPDVDMITGVDYYSNIIAQYIKNNGLEGQLLTGGSDLAPAQVDGLREGYVAFGLGQNPYLQGFYPVMIMHQEIEYGIRPISIDTGTDVVTPENVDEYNPEFR